MIKLAGSKPAADLSNMYALAMLNRLSPKDRRMAEAVIEGLFLMRMKEANQAVDEKIKKHGWRIIK